MLEVCNWFFQDMLSTSASRKRIFMHLSVRSNQFPLAFSRSPDILELLSAVPEA